MARALLVGCGCRARRLGASLIEEGWLVRGTTRDPSRRAEIASAGIEPALADPDAVGTVLDLIGDVTILCWLLGSAQGGPEHVGALHGTRLERLLEELVDTPVRGVVYEAAGSVPGETLERGAETVLAAERRWRIPARVVTESPGERDAWSAAMSAAVAELIA
jgi:uncharacterized protein YbjT (DUF2867 family)